MSQVNYAAMSDQELRQYFLKHQQDSAALQAYLERRWKRPVQVITTVDDLDFDIKIQAAICKKISK